jgi:uncharacterized membrane protein
LFLDKLREKRNRLKKFAHIFAGMVILLHSYERYENGHSTYLFFAFAGLIFLTVALFHHQLQHKYPKIDYVFFLIEGFLSFIIAYEYFHAGKSIIPFFYLFAGSLQIFSIYLFSNKFSKLKKNKEK